MHVDASSKEWRDAKILACWTTSASFLLDGTTHSLDFLSLVYPGGVNLAIKDSNGNVAGCILMPREYAEEWKRNPEKCEFILLTRSLRRDDDRMSHIKYFDHKVYPERDWCELNVMLIERLADNTAMRLGVGVIHEDAWVNASPRGTFIKLV
jgi:hypothetical protein